MLDFLKDAKQDLEVTVNSRKTGKRYLGIVKAAQDFPVGDEGKTQTIFLVLINGESKKPFSEDGEEFGNAGGAAAARFLTELHPDQRGRLVRRMLRDKAMKLINAGGEDAFTEAGWQGLITDLKATAACNKTRQERKLTALETACKAVKPERAILHAQNCPCEACEANRPQAPRRVVITRGQNLWPASETKDEVA